MDNYIYDIKITAPKTTLKMNDTVAFKYMYQPLDAEDINDIKITFSNPRVLALSGPNEVTAIGEGDCDLIVSSRDVTQSLSFTVLVSPKGIKVDKKYLYMSVNSYANLTCEVLPHNAMPKPNIIWTSSDPGAISIYSSTDGRTGRYACTLLCKAQGRAVISCKIENTDIKDEVLVQTTKAAKKCYVATAVYGSYDCPEVWTLRRFRDMFLEKRMWGRAFIKTYYAISPRIISLFGKRKWFNKINRLALDSFVGKLKKKGYRDTPYYDTAGGVIPCVNDEKDE